MSLIKYKYCWKELTEEGLLKEPKPIGSHYNEVSVNGLYLHGFDSEHEAEVWYSELLNANEYKYQIQRDLVLIKRVFYG